MRKIILPLLAIISSTMAWGQNTFKAILKDSESKEPLLGAIAIVKGTTNGAISGVNGLIEIKNIPDGQQIILFKYIGYQERFDTFSFPLQQAIAIEILLTEDIEETEEVVISSTRSSRSIEDIPTRVEFIAGEELEEKANMKPGDIRMVLSESTGIQTQQTSATSANAAIRIQGLDGRYTQILKDGFPLYFGASSGLGLLQIPPLDLKQVEVIKGSASTLYGGGAIAGLVNLISKTPQKEREIKFHLNGTSGKGLDLNGFYSQRANKIGTTIFAAHNRNWAYDPANIDLSAIPKFERYTFNPKLFLYPSEKTTIVLGVNTTLEDRIGGDIHYINGKGDSTHSYFEKNTTQRFSTQFSAEHKLGDSSHIIVKNSISYFNRILSTPGYTFNGTQYATFSEVNYEHNAEKMEWIVGINLWTDKFTEKQLDTLAVRDYNQTTLGVFVQNIWKATQRLNIETGFRTDYVIDYGFALLPRISALYKINKKLSSRVGGGLGYKTPTIFTEESERIQYRGVLGISPTANRLETSYGTNWDFNYKTAFADGQVLFTLNHLFFYTYLNHPLILTPQANGTYQFVNINGFVDTKGTETNIKIGYKDFKLFLGYTYTDAKIHSNGTVSDNPLTAKHRINSVLMYEADEKWKVGLEAYYFSKQKLSDGTIGRQYVMCGFMVERLWEKFSLYINFENFLDARQTRFDTIYTGTVTRPIFREIYAPLEGFIINGGLKIRL
ncbi:MAG: TonB-dependent receptor [Bacteroidetes bacterium]|nr:MAG: TonB-dependent receptor [Bacteroidota bacterium]